MIARARFWCAINAYALLLEVLGFLAAVWALWTFGTWPISAVLTGTLAAYLIYAGICVHLSYGEKVRMFRALLRRNRRAFRRDSFKEFMGVPCHRLVVRMVLHRLDCPSEFSRLKRMYYRYPWEKRLPQATVLRVFKNSQEGEQWLLQQQSNPT